MLRMLACRLCGTLFAVQLAANGGLAGEYFDARVPRARHPELVVPVPVRCGHKCGDDKAVPCRRGIAIMSPVESPDCCDYRVGGKPRIVHYYPDYCVDWKRGPRFHIPQNGCGYPASHGRPAAGESGEYEIEAQTAGSTDFGAFSGAATDEASLLRLGGFVDPQLAPSASQSPDLIDQIQGGP